jgi:NADH dehydrogenase
LPHERGVLPIQDFHLSKSTKKFIRKNTLTLGINQNFDTVIEECAKTHKGRDETWINEEIISLYKELHRMGYAHSVEVYTREDHELVGGLYGLSLGSAFFGESMFSRVSNASKLALTGFIGRYLVRDLAKRGITVRVASRIPNKGYYLKPAGNVGQIVLEYCDYNDEASIGKAIHGSDYVINLTGILYENKKGQFEHVHRDIPTVMAKACHYHEAESFVHVSALGVGKARSKYAQSKLAGEEAIASLFPKTTIVRPSILFGPEDDFFNRFAAMAQLAPALPLIGGGKTLFQPVYVADVAETIARCLDAPQMKGQILELGGPEILSFKDCMEKMFGHTNQQRMLMPLPWLVARFMAVFLSLLPKPLLTQDQITSLKTDNVVSGEYPNCDALGVDTRNLDIILPQYLNKFRPGGRFSTEVAK